MTGGSPALAALRPLLTEVGDTKRVRVADAPGRMAAVREHFADQQGVRMDDLDGLTVDLPDGAWFNLRASNTEPLLRLNVEARDEARMADLRDRVLGMVRA